MMGHVVTLLFLHIKCEMKLYIYEMQNNSLKYQTIGQQNCI